MARIETFQPELEQNRARQQAIYERYVEEATGIKGDFRSARGYRKDKMFFFDPGEYAIRERVFDLPRELPEFVRLAMFASAAGVQQRDGYIRRSSAKPTKKAIAAAHQRYDDLPHLIGNRQDYEETLGLARKSGFYRVTAEPTQRGQRFLIWPLAPGSYSPQMYADQRQAEQDARFLNTELDPRRTRTWWQAKPVKPSVWAEWLPSATYWRSL